jgi:hypothetical protein
MHAMLGVKSMPAALRTWRTMTYIAVMGKGFTTTVLQLADIVPAIIGGGYGNTIASVAHIFGKDEVTVGRDLRMARYQFGDMTNAIEAENIASRAADAVFTATGLKHLGRGTQQVLVNSVLRRYRAAARRGKFSDRQMRSLLDYFSGDKAEVERLAADLAAGVKSERVLLLGWNILSDWHPVSMGELPAGYTNHPVGRIWYILKSYTIKMLDNYRREGIDEMRIAVQAKDYRRFLDSFFRLMHMMVLLYVSGCTIDTINDYIVRGLEPDDDVLWDNIFKIVGISRYAQYRAWQEGFYAGAMAQFAPPVLTPFDYARRDVAAFLKAQEEGEDFGLRDMEMTRMIPLFGDWIFWRGEAGQEKVEKVKQRRED